MSVRGRRVVGRKGRRAGEGTQSQRPKGQRRGGRTEARAKALRSRRRVGRTLRGEPWWTRDDLCAEDGAIRVGRGGRGGRVVRPREVEAAAVRRHTEEELGARADRCALRRRRRRWSR